MHNEVSHIINETTIQWVNALLHTAVEQRISDIHLEPFESSLRIRFRKDGLLFEHTRLPSHHTDSLLARIKVMAKCDISEKRLPQDGRFSLSKDMDARVCTCPTLWGEKAVIRLLNQSAQSLTLDQLGLTDDQQGVFRKTLDSPQGLILVTGPTGSGKTVTLYSALTYLNVIERNISTCEDPIEIQLPGINQVQIHPKAGLTFAKVLKAFLRQDPDVLMVGEIRDLETAEIAFKAANTGHLVLSTLHANSCAQTLTRLTQMGIPEFHIRNTLSLVIAQRLLRQLTPTGFEGRTGIFELMPMPKAHSDLCLYEAGQLKVQQGITTLSELNRVLPPHAQ